MRTSPSLLNSAASHGRLTATTMPSTTPATTPHSSRRRAEARASCDGVGAEEPADHRLRGDGERVEREREEQQDLHRHLVRGDVVVAEAGGDGGCGEQGHEQRTGPDDEAAADGGVRSDAGRARPQRPARAPGPATDHHEEGDGGAVLRDDGAPRRSRDAEIQRVDEDQLEQQVHRVRGDRDHEGGAGVLHAAQVAGPGEGEEQRRRAEDADPEVRDRERVHHVRGAHGVDDERRERELRAR